MSSVMAQEASLSQRQDDDYTGYELLHCAVPRPLRCRGHDARSALLLQYDPQGSVASDERMIDPMIGRQLRWKVVGGPGAQGGASRRGSRHRVHQGAFGEPVPANGQARVLIDKTYKDAPSYKTDRDTIVFIALSAFGGTASCCPPVTRWSAATYRRRRRRMDA
jgi:hypothetical protein